MTRRELARAVGTVGAGCLLPLLRGSHALGAESGIPKRVVFIDLADGMMFQEWEPRPPVGAASYGPRQFALGPMMDPLSDYLQDMIVFENLDMVSELSDPISASNAHLAGGTHQLTGAYRFNEDLAGAISIDQYLANELQAAGQLTALKSVEISVQNMGAGYVEGGPGFVGPVFIRSTSGPGENMTGIMRPDLLFERLFPAEQLEPLDATQALTRSERLFGYLRSEHMQIAERLSGEDRAKLEQHAQLLRELEERRRVLFTAEDRRHLWPDVGLLSEIEGINWGRNLTPEARAERWNITVDLDFRLAAAALHADVTRVMSITILDNAPETLNGYRSGLHGTTDFHGLTHLVNERQENAANQDPSAREVIFNDKMVLLAKLRALLDELAELRETDGSRLLDHTLVVVTSHIADGSHALTNLPWITIGNLDGALDTGQLIQFPRIDGRGRPHNDLFVTIANAMGIAIDSFGTSGISTGPIVEMRA